MSDLALRWNIADFAADLVVEANDLARDDGLETAVLLSLFTDREAASGDVLGAAPSAGRTVVRPTGRMRRVSRTNWLIRSQDLSDSNWHKNTGVVVTPDAVMAPDGTMTADQVSYDGTGTAGDYRFYGLCSTLIPGGMEYNASIWVRAAAPVQLVLVVNGPSQVVNVTTEWQRVKASGVALMALNPNVFVWSAASNNDPFTIYVWGGQVERGLEATAYIPTAGAPVTIISSVPEIIEVTIQTASPPDRRGWWGDALPVVEGDRIGSRLWLLARAKDIPSVRARAEEYVREAMAWLLEDHVAERVGVVVSVPRPGLLGLEVTIHRPAVTDPTRYRYTATWTAQEA